MEQGSADLVVQRGCAQLDSPSSGFWVSRQDVPLHRLVEGVLTDRTRSTSVPRLSETIPYGSTDRWYEHSDPVVLAPAAHIETWERLRKRAEQQEARERQDREAHLANLRALAERQTTVLHSELERLARQAPDRCSRVWLGVPPTRWSGDAACDPREAGGNESTAMGLVIWDGDSKDALRLTTVVCPVASRITPSLAESWARRRVRILAASASEANRLALALGWPVQSVEVVAVAEATS